MSYVLINNNYIHLSYRSAHAHTLTHPQTHTNTHAHTHTHARTHTQHMITDYINNLLLRIRKYMSSLSHECYLIIMKQGKQMKKLWYKLI